MASSDPNDPDHHEHFQTANQATSRSAQRDEVPLRLLVIGDSLAAGVGIRESSTPILPAAIATSLSRALGGRAVYWTCTGKPGMSSRLLVREISNLPSQDHMSPLFQRFQAWQRQSRQRAHERLEAARLSAVEWWEHRRDEIDDSISNDNTTAPTTPESSETKHPVRKWIDQRVTPIAKQLRRDVVGLRRILQSIGPRPGEEADAKPTLTTPSSSLSSTSHYPTVDLNIIGSYDIAVVLIGFNDLKDAFLPHMMSDDRARLLEEAQQAETREGRSALVRIYHALQDQMRKALPERSRRQDPHHHENSKPIQLDEGATNDAVVSVSPTMMHHTSKAEEEGETIPSNVKHPLIVFPALPFDPIAPCQSIPLRWFLVPLIREVDHRKKMLATLFPGSVLFVEAPRPTKDRPPHVGLNSIERDYSILFHAVGTHQDDPGDERSNETLRFMRQHYHSWFSSNRNGSEDYALENYNLYEMVADDVYIMPTESSVNNRVGQELVSCDGIHPSDLG